VGRPDASAARALLITGTVGSGKTAVADAVGDLLAQAGIAHAVIDVDWLRRSWPCPPGDPFNGELALRNLRAVARNYLDTGGVRLVLAGVVESRSERGAYQAALGVPLAVCRLRVDLPVVRERLARRHEGDADRLGCTSTGRASCTASWSGHASRTWWSTRPRGPSVRSLGR
jgi:adenylylsulfate kinase